MIDVDLMVDPPTVRLDEPEDFRRFHVSASGEQDGSRLAQALEDQGVGWVAGDDAFVRTAAVQRLAAGRVGDGWSADFEAMLAFARSKGWLDPSGEAVQAHVGWD